MAIFRCVGCFIFIFLKESASLVLLARAYTLHVSISVFLLILLLLACVFVCLETRQADTHTQETAKLTSRKTRTRNSKINEEIELAIHV
jgi:predicted membrane protein